MNIKIKRFALLIVFFATTLVIIGQNTGTNSPYGRFGFGELATPSFGASGQMGGLSFGLRGNQQINPGNPASYSAIDSMTMIFDFGVSAQSARMSDGINRQNFGNANLDFIAIQFPVLRNMGISFGVLPFSRVGYNFGGLRWTDNMQYDESHRGTGGLTQLYGGVAWSPVNNFSIGVNVNYMFGRFEHSNTAVPLIHNAAVRNRRISYSIRTVRYNIGVQQTIPLNNNRSITIGAVYTPQLSTNSDVNPASMLFASDPWQFPWQLPIDISQSDTIRNATFQLPHSFGLGFTFNTPRWLFGIDGEYQLWSGLKYNEHPNAYRPDDWRGNLLDGMTRDTRFNNTLRIASGFEYVRNPFSTQFFHRVRVRGGVSFANSYTNVNVFDPASHQFLGVGSFRQYGANVGFGVPLPDFRSGHPTMLNIGFHYTRKQPDRDFMIAQDMFKISINLNFHELWFFRRLIY